MFTGRDGLRALLFDVQGTATDFHSTIRSAAEQVAGPRNPGIDWCVFVNDWRAAYFETTSAGIGASGVWTAVESIYRALWTYCSIERDGLNESGRVELNSAWKRLDPWPDAVAGLARMRRRYVLAALSNADVNAVVSITRHCDFAWHAVFAAEMAGVFKPDPRIQHSRPAIWAARPMTS